MDTWPDKPAYVLNRGNGSATVFHKDGDYTARFDLARHREGNLRTSVNRQQPLGTAEWQAEIATTLGLVLPNRNPLDPVFVSFARRGGPKTGPRLLNKSGGSFFPRQGLQKFSWLRICGNPAAFFTLLHRQVLDLLEWPEGQMKFIVFSFNRLTRKNPP